MSKPKVTEDVVPQDVEIVAGYDVVRAIERESVDVQITTAHAYPRDMARVMRKAETLIGEDPDLAGACGYELTRSGKVIMGPSIRMAEIVATAWGNLRVQVVMEPVGPHARTITVHAMAHDLESNLAVRVPKTRRITNREGERYGEDMIVTTQNAAVSIAYRDAIFRVVPRAYVQRLYTHAMRVSAGEEQSLPDLRRRLVEAFAGLGVDEGKLLAACRVMGSEGLTLEHVGALRSIYRRIKLGEITLEQAFPGKADEDAVEAARASEDLLDETLDEAGEAADGGA